MTGRDLVALVGSNPLVLAGVLGAPPLFAIALSFLHKRGNGGNPPWRLVYSAIVYSTCIPGMLSTVLTAYTLFFSRENLMDQNVLVYLAPIASMVATLMLVRKNVSFDAIPGFDRIWGLMTMIGMTFVIVLAVEKTRIFIVSVLPIGALIGICIFVFALMKWGAYMAFRGSHEPKKDAPKLGL